MCHCSVWQFLNTNEAFGFRCIIGIIFGSHGQGRAGGNGNKKDQPELKNAELSIELIADTLESP